MRAPAVHVRHPQRARGLVQRVDVLGAQKEPIAEPLLEGGQREVGGVWRHRERLGPPLRVESPDQRRVAREAPGGRDVLDVVLLP